MLSRRRLLAGGILAGLAAVPLASRLLVASRGGSGVVMPTGWQVSGASTLEVNLAGVFSGAGMTITVGGTPQATGYQPTADGFYGALWTRDHAYTLWHRPELLTAAQRRQFVTYYLSRRTTGVETDPDGGTLPADWIPDRISSTGTAAYKNAGASDLPFMDGIAFVVLALWADWHLTGDTATFAACQAAIEDCLAALPISGTGCVWSDPAAPSVDYGFTDTVKKTGDCAYGTALLAWTYKMLAEIADEAPGGTYHAARASAEAGLVTLRRANGFYAGSSVNNATRDDVWATALIVAEGLVSGADRLASAQAIADAYNAGTIAQNGFVRHLPTGQTWAGTATTTGTYQNGGYWPTPVWDCVRAVDLVDPALARTWAAEFVTEVAAEYAAEGTVGAGTAPYEWRNGATLSTPKGYTCHAALVHRFV